MSTPILFTSLIDTHLHLYPNYDLRRAFDQLLNANVNIASDVTRIACLAERYDCHYFEALSSGETTLQGFDIETSVQNELQLTRIKDGLNLTLLPGRQIITRENIEILALACPELIEDKQPALDVIYQVNRLSHIPVVAWSPGKWFGARGKVVKRLIDELEPEDFLIGDTTLRPYGWATPGLMRYAMSKGYGVIAGSDPLPFNGEEAWLGAYCTRVESETKLGATELLHAMKSKQTTIQWNSTGRRTNILNLFGRLRKNAASKKQA